MDQETIRKIAEEVASHISYPWAFLALQVAITLVAAAAGAFFGEYFKTRGKNLATTADFERLQNELRANTQLVETVKSEVGQKDWAAREWMNIRRLKLEEILKKLSECEVYREQHQQESVLRQDRQSPPDSAYELTSLATLYFPEMTKEISAYLLLYRTLIVASARLALDLGKAGSNETAQDKAYETFRAEFNAKHPEILVARLAIDASARRQLEKIMDISGR